jgi:hypothetical protein
LSEWIDRLLHPDRICGSREWLSGMKRNLQCLGANLFDEPFFQPDEFGRGPLGDLEPDEGEPRQALLTV